MTRSQSILWSRCQAWCHLPNQLIYSGAGERDRICLLGGIEYCHRPGFFSLHCFWVSSPSHLPVYTQHRITESNIRQLENKIYWRIYLYQCNSWICQSLAIVWSGLRRIRSKSRRAESLKAVVLVSVRENSWTWRGGGQVVDVLWNWDWSWRLSSEGRAASYTKPSSPPARP